jgi:hypothetical protein
MSSLDDSLFRERHDMCRRVREGESVSLPGLRLIEKAIPVN